MLNFLRLVDIEIFFLINSTLKNSVFDILMPFITNNKNFNLIFFLIFISLMFWGKTKGRVAGVSIVSGTIISDILCSRILKHLINRPRPFMVMDGVIKMVSAAGPSMPSSHAMNSFTVATMVFLFFRKKNVSEKKTILQTIKLYWIGFITYFFAFLSAYSRVYVGVHYPADIFVGAILGIMLGYVVYIITVKYIIKNAEI